jgi:hypothetical protein
MACPDDPWGPSCGDDGGGGGGGGGGDGCWDNDVSEFYLGPFIPFACWLPPDQAPTFGSGGSPPSCEQNLESTISTFLQGKESPLASEAEDFVTDAQLAGLNPYLLVAISGGESTFGKAPVSQSTNNAFGLMHRVTGKNGRPRSVLYGYSDWNAGIVAAGHVVDNQFVAGNVTVAQMFSGKQGAYCFGNCKVDEQQVESFFRALSGENPNNALNLLWPCQN